MGKNKEQILETKPGAVIFAGSNNACCEEGEAVPRPKASCDQVVWVKNAIKKAIRMGIALSKLRQVGADDHTLNYGIDGIAEGATVEVIRHSLYMDLDFTNLKRPEWMEK